MTPNPTRRPARAAAALGLAGGCGTPGQALSIHTPNLAAVPDGTWQGHAAAFVVQADVAVTTRDGRLTGCTILRHDCGLGRPAESLADLAVSRQTLELDAVAGATLSSKVILKAMENALLRATASSTDTTTKPTTGEQ